MQSTFGVHLVHLRGRQEQRSVHVNNITMIGGSIMLKTNVYMMLKQWTMVSGTCTSGLLEHVHACPRAIKR